MSFDGDFRDDLGGGGGGGGGGAAPPPPAVAEILGGPILTQAGFSLPYRLPVPHLVTGPAAAAAKFIGFPWYPSLTQAGEKSYFQLVRELHAELTAAIAGLSRQRIYVMLPEEFNSKVLETVEFFRGMATDLSQDPSLMAHAQQQAELSTFQDELAKLEKDVLASFGPSHDGKSAGLHCRWRATHGAKGAWWGRGEVPGCFKDAETVVAVRLLQLTDDSIQKIGVYSETDTLLDFSTSFFTKAENTLPAKPRADQVFALPMVRPKHAYQVDENGDEIPFRFRGNSSLFQPIKTLQAHVVSMYALLSSDTSTQRSMYQLYTEQTLDFLQKMDDVLLELKQLATGAEFDALIITGKVANHVEAFIQHYQPKSAIEGALLKRMAPYFYSDQRVACESQAGYGLDNKKSLEQVLVSEDVHADIRKGMAVLRRYVPHVLAPGSTWFTGQDMHDKSGMRQRIQQSENPLAYMRTVIRNQAKLRKQTASHAERALNQQGEDRLVGLYTRFVGSGRPRKGQAGISLLLAQRHPTQFGSQFAQDEQAMLAAVAVMRFDAYAMELAGEVGSKVDTDADVDRVLRQIQGAGRRLIDGLRGQVRGRVVQDRQLHRQNDQAIVVRASEYAAAQPVALVAKPRSVEGRLVRTQDAKLDAQLGVLADAVAQITDDKLVPIVLRRDELVGKPNYLRYSGAIADAAGSQAIVRADHPRTVLARPGEAPLGQLLQNCGLVGEALAIAHFIVDDLNQAGFGVLARMVADAAQSLQQKATSPVTASADRRSADAILVVRQLAGKLHACRDAEEGTPRHDVGAAFLRADDVTKLKLPLLQHGHRRKDVKVKDLGKETQQLLQNMQRDLIRLSVASGCLLELVSAQDLGLQDDFVAGLAGMQYGRDSDERSLMQVLVSLSQTLTQLAQNRMFFSITAPLRIAFNVLEKRELWDKVQATHLAQPNQEHDEFMQLLAFLNRLRSQPEQKQTFAELQRRGQYGMKMVSDKNWQAVRDELGAAGQALVQAAAQSQAVVARTHRVAAYGSAQLAPRQRLLLWGELLSAFPSAGAEAASMFTSYPCPDGDAIQRQIGVTLAEYVAHPRPYAGESSDTYRGRMAACAAVDAAVPEGGALLVLLGTFDYTFRWLNRLQHVVRNLSHQRIAGKALTVVDVARAEFLHAKNQLKWIANFLQHLANLKRGCALTVPVRPDVSRSIGYHTGGKTSEQVNPGDEAGFPFTGAVAHGGQYGAWPQLAGSSAVAHSVLAAGGQRSVVRAQPPGAATADAAGGGGGGGAPVAWPPAGLGQHSVFAGQPPAGMQRPAGVSAEDWAAMLQAMLRP